MSDHLLDTHALIWWWLGDPALSVAARRTIEESQDRIFVSAVSTYEIANKLRRGRLDVLGDMLADLDGALAADGFVHLPLSSRHARHAGLMRGEHRDPFDRMIAAQGFVEDMTVVTCDAEIAGFGCKVLW